MIFEFAMHSFEISTCCLSTERSLIWPHLFFSAPENLPGTDPTSTPLTPVKSY